MFICAICEKEKPDAERSDTDQDYVSISPVCISCFVKNLESETPDVFNDIGITVNDKSLQDKQ